VNEERQPISDEMRWGFESAVAAYKNWWADRTRPLNATMQRRVVPVEFVCDLVEKFHGTMSEAEYAVLYDRAAGTGGIVPYPENRSFAAGARCLRSLVAYQKQLNDMRS
jgi:hypothetical protein